MNQIMFFFDKEVIKWFYFDKDENVFFCLVKGYENVYKGTRIKKGRAKQLARVAVEYDTLRSAAFGTPPEPNFPGSNLPLSCPLSPCIIIIKIQNISNRNMNEY